MQSSMTFREVVEEVERRNEYQKINLAKGLYHEWKSFADSVFNGPQALTALLAWHGNIFAAASITGTVTSEKATYASLLSGMTITQADLREHMFDSKTLSDALKTVENAHEQLRGLYIGAIAVMLACDGRHHEAEIAMLERTFVKRIML